MSEGKQNEIKEKNSAKIAELEKSQKAIFEAFRRLEEWCEEKFVSDGSYHGVEFKSDRDDEY